jgi:alkanesulfonate monooxygenase SsuD/methylene tetrahydromethanopterin reductase-like flavin-dependent oxidoreductase (luciferase family)
MTLDGPVPPPPPFEGSQTFTHVLYEMAKRENMTLRDLYNLTAAARGHWVICGTPRRSPTPRRMVRREGGRRVQHPAGLFPGAFAEFVDLVVPELQRRGLFRHDYEGTTLRDHFGLAPVPAPGAPRQALAGE